MKERDVIIIGGGASGICCAINLKKINKELKVTVLEQNDKILKKVLKTGNGKCNIGNTNINSEKYKNYDFFKEYISSFNTEKYFESLGLVLKKDEMGRLYPYSESANNVVDILRNEASKLNVEVVTGFTVISVKKNKDIYEVHGSEIYTSKVVVLACGSIAQCQTNGYELAKKLNHTITPLKAGLTPIKVKEDIKSLQGIRIKCRATVKGFERSGEILFKEDGISGILSLELSRYVSENSVISLDLAPTLSEEFLKLFIEKRISDESLNRDDLLLILSGILPKMLALLIVKKSESISECIKNIKSFNLTVSGLYGFNSAQIVVGGVSLKEMNNNFESKLEKNLYIIGEMLDVDGDCGGYNLYFAWLSANVSSETIVKQNFTK